MPTLTTSIPIFFGISSFQILAMFRRGLFYSYLSIYLRHFLGLSVTETTLFATFPMLLNIVCQNRLWGPYSDRTQRRRSLIIAGELMAGVGTVIVWGAHRLTWQPAAAGYVIIVGLSLVEIFWSMSNVGWSALISDLYPDTDRSAIQGKLSSMGGIGRIAGVWIGGLLYDGLDGLTPGWGFSHGALFFVAAGAMFLSVIPMWFVPEGGIAYRGSEAETAGRNESYADTRVWAIFLCAMTFINFGRNATAVIQSQYLVIESPFGVSSTVLSYIVNTQSVAMIAAGLAAGSIGRRLGDGNALMAATAAAIISLLMMAWTDSLAVVYASNFIRGASEVVIMAASYSFASRLIPPSRRARRFSTFNATFFLSWGLAGTLIAGPIADLMMLAGFPQAAAYRMTFLSSAVVALIGGIILGSLLTRLRSAGTAVAID